MRRAGERFGWGRGMVKLSDLTPAEMARHLGRPSGTVGLAVGDYMNEVNRRLTLFAYERLEPPPAGEIVEIGFGNGKLVDELLKLASDLYYVGVDASDAMVAAAHKHNASLVRAGRCDFLQGSVEDMPFPAGSFDRALTVNSIYFWPDQLAGLAEIARVLRPGGRLVLASMSPETGRKLPMYSRENGFSIPSREELIALHRQAGFAEVDCASYDEQAVRFDGSTLERSFNVTVARR